MDGDIDAVVVRRPKKVACKDFAKLYAAHIVDLPDLCSQVRRFRVGYAEKASSKMEDWITVVPKFRLN